MNPIVRKIQKLLALAENQSGKPEGEVAAKLAHKMMMAHAISMEDVSNQEQVTEDPVERQQTDNLGRGVWKWKLYSTLAAHCNCRMSYNTSRNGVKVQLYGHRTDIEVCKYLYDVCFRQIQKAAKSYTNPYHWSQRTAKNDFRRSAVQGLGTKLSEIRNVSKDENPTGFGLVLNRKKKVSDWVDDTFRFGRGRDYDYNHNQAGYTAGRNVRLSGGVTGQRKLKG